MVNKNVSDVLMEQSNLFYQIKTLEKYITRLFLNDLESSIVPPTPTQMQIMEYVLKHSKEIIYQKDLEKILNLRRATVSGVLKTMEKNNLLERIVDTNDTRQKQILHLKKVKEMESQLVKNISEEEQLQFILILQKMQNNLKEVVNKKEGIKIC